MKKNNSCNLCFCGHDCSKCITFLATINDDDVLRKVSQEFYYREFGRYIPDENIHCLGGRSNETFCVCIECPFKKCCKEKGIVSCSECGVYPCDMLADYMRKHVNKSNILTDCTSHYDMLIDENNDPFRDAQPLREYMDKWDGKTFIDMLRLCGKEDVFEIGVGTGRLAARIAPLSHSFTGIDISPKTIARASENLSDIENVDLICGDFMTYKSNVLYDVVYSSLTFFHFQNKYEALMRAVSLIKRSGRLVLSLDKASDFMLNYGTRKVRIYPDSPNVVANMLDGLGMLSVTSTETEFAVILSAVKA